MRPQERRDAGFTLVEVLIVLTILGVAGAIFASTVINAVRVDDRTRDRADVQQSITLSMDRISKEARVAAPLVTIADHSLVVDTYPTQPSGSTVRQRHTFTQSAGTLVHQVQRFAPATSSVATTTSTRTLASGLQPAAATFTGRDRAGTATTVAAKVASIEIQLTGVTDDGQPFPARTVVFLRNFQG